MKSLDFDWQIDEFMVYCRSIQLWEKSMMAYEQTLRLFERWCNEELNNLSEFARVCDLSRTTVYKYLSLLEV